MKDKIASDLYSKSDAKLARMASKNTDALGVLYERYVERVFNYIYYRVNSKQDAEDLCSQTFLRIVRSLPTTDIRKNFAAWLFTIARNIVTDFYRKPNDTQALDPELLGAIPESMGIGYVGINIDESIFLKEAISSLTEEQREVLRLRFAGELTFKEIAAVLDKSEMQTKRFYYKVIAQLGCFMETDNEKGNDVED